VLGWRGLVYTAPVAVALALFVGTSPAAAGEGFGRSGVVTTPLRGQSVTAEALIVDPAGRITVAGPGFSDARRRQTFVMVRYMSDGRRDASFGSKGIVNELLPDRRANDSSEPVSMVAQPDGKLVVAGLVGVPSTDEGQDTGEQVDAIEVRRYLSDGAADVSFGVDGKRTVPFVGGETVCGAAPHAVAFGPGATIIVAGSQGCGGEGDEEKDLVVARLLADGSMDESFGPAGLQRPSSPNSGEGLAATSDGQILVAGSNLGTQVFATGRLTVSHLAVDSKGRIVVAGTGFNGRETRSAIGVVRLLADGRPDRAFGTTGIATLAPGPGASNSTTALALSRDGAAVVTANRQTDTASRALVAQVSSNGVPDRRFGVGGQRTLAFPGAWDEANDVAVLGDGSVVVAGATGRSRWRTSIALARLTPP